MILLKLSTIAVLFVREMIWLSVPLSVTAIPVVGVSVYESKPQIIVAGDSDSSAFEFPPPPTAPLAPVPAEPAEDAEDAEDADATDDEKAPRDWAAFFEDFLLPLLAVIMGLFGGGFGVRFRDRQKRRKAKKDANDYDESRIRSMLNALVPVLVDKFVRGDKEKQRQTAILARAKKALDEAVGDGS